MKAGGSDPIRHNKNSLIQSKGWRENSHRADYTRLEAHFVSSPQHASQIRNHVPAQFPD